jgi:hypothetical protein
MAGRIFPRIEIRKALRGDIPKTCKAKGIEPRSSTIGERAIKNV